MESYEEILTRMQNKFTEMSGFEPDDASDIGIRLKVLAGEIFSLNTNIEWLKNQMFVQSATGQCLDFHALERGLQRKRANKSTGSLTFSRQTTLDYDVDIPAGTICSLSGADAVRYVTTERAVLPAGELSVTVAAESEIGGKSTNTEPNTINVMVTPPVGVMAVTNPVAFTGGYDAEADDELRARVMESYKNISNGTNIAFYKDEVLKYDGIHSASVIPLARGAGTVDIYVADKGKAASDSLISTIQSDISKLREINIDIEVKSPKLVKVDVLVELTIEQGYVYIEIRNECERIINEFFANLSIGEQVIFAAIGHKIFEIEGVKNYLFSHNLDFDKVVKNDELPVVGVVSISER